MRGIPAQTITITPIIETLHSTLLVQYPGELRASLSEHTGMNKGIFHIRKMLKVTYSAVRLL